MPAYLLHAHIVLVTTYRRRVLTARMLDDARTLMDSICRRTGATLVEFTGEPDHIGLLIEFTPSIALATLIKQLKGSSARTLRQQHAAHVKKYLWGTHFRSSPSVVTTAGGTPLRIIRQHIDQHNRPRSTEAALHPRTEVRGTAPPFR